MSILTRFSNIIKANINDLLDKAEDPAKMIDQYLRNAMEDYAEVKKETASVIAEETRCQRIVDKAKADIQKYDELAKKALRANNDEDAKVFIAEKQKAESQLAGVEKAYQVAHENAQKMRQMHDKLKSDIEQLQTRRANIKATMSVAKTQERINAAADALNGAHGSIAAFDRMEDKAAEMLDKATAVASLDQPDESDADRLAEKYGKGSVTSVDEELARMKAEMGL